MYDLHIVTLTTPIGQLAMEAAIGPALHLGMRVNVLAKRGSNMGRVATVKPTPRGDFFVNTLSGKGTGTATTIPASARILVAELAAVIASL